MNNIIDNETYYETYTILKQLNLLEELPDDIKTQIISKGNLEGNFSIDRDIPLYEQIDNEQTKILLSYLYLKYINKNEKERRILIERYRQNDINKENKLRDIYNPDNLFKNRIQNAKEEKQEIMALAKIQKDTLIKRIARFFNKFLKKFTDK